MRFNRSIILFLCVLSLCCCRRKEPDNNGEAGYLLVDRQVSDHQKTISPDGMESAFSISCDGDWDVTVQEEAVSWINLGERVASGKNNEWSVPYTIASNETLYPRNGSVLFKAGEHLINVTFSQAVPDPLTLNKVPGFYGIDGKNVIPSGSRQSSSFRYGEKWCFRILDVSSLTIYALGNIPWDLTPGSVLTVSYKMVQAGIEETYEPAIQVEVLRVSSGMVWLKKSESEYFILER